ncbi:SGNH/GDSL hydrolase family protein [Paenisporosarcina sp. NPDC076898]|uniref:SGNH/GDSL hydrolase family protein n=1 Tax=unclassified Paenisporosarcina TaxID=2642018 RepID=UPI003CFEAFE1
MSIIKRSKKLFSLVLAFVLVGFSLIPAMVSANSTAEAQIHYVALGDSLAAGQTPYKEIGKGYTDLLAEKFESLGYLKSFDKRYAVPGYTTENVLADIRNDVKKDTFTPDVLGIKATIKNSTTITLDVGANDLLKQLKIDTTTGAISIDPAMVPQIIGQLSKNVAEIVSEIKKINPTVNVYIMGYYNSFPYVPKEQQPQLLLILDGMNKAIQQVSAQTGSTFVPTAEVIAQNYPLYLPNPKDIHLSLAGYEAIANEFWKVMEPKVVEVPEQPKPTEPAVKVYWEGLLMKKGQIGKVTIQTPINLWKRNSENQLEYVRTLKAGEQYRVYRYDHLHGGQYGLGEGYYVTNISGYVKYQTPSKKKLELVH